MFHWPFHWSSRKSGPPNGKKPNDFMVEDAVRIGPVSNPNSLLTGKLIGNFAKFRPPPRFFCPVTAQNQSLADKFPKHCNREIFRRVAGKISRLTGKLSPPIGIEILLRQEQFSELLEKFAVASEVAGGIFPLHLPEKCAGALQYFVTRSRGGSARSGGCGR